MCHAHVHVGRYIFAEKFSVCYFHVSIRMVNLKLKYHCMKKNEFLKSVVLLPCYKCVHLLSDCLSRDCMHIYLDTHQTYM